MPVAVGQSRGRYRIEEEVRAGGMGVVYRAHDEKLGRDLAIKVLKPGTLDDENARKRPPGELEPRRQAPLRIAAIFRDQLGEDSGSPP